jgi:hypothetical protein
MRQSTAETPVMLNSWKEIASYLGRGVRTVQRWERELGLPVRIGNGKRSPVYATMAEVKFWIRIQDSRRLLASLHELARIPVRMRSRLK